MLEVGANSKVFKLIILDEIIADAFFVLQPSLDAAAISIEFAPENSFDNSHDDWSIAGNRGWRIRLISRKRKLSLKGIR